MGKTTDYVIANQFADWCGNPFSFGTAQGDADSYAGVRTGSE